MTGRSPPGPFILLSPSMATTHTSCVRPEESLISVLEQRAEKTPDATAYIFVPAGEGSDVRITCAQLRDRSRQIGSYLRTKPVRKDHPVLLLFHPGIDYICAFFGCQYAAAIPVPAYPPTHARQFDRLQAIIDDAATGFALSSRKELDAVPPIAARMEGLSIKSWLSVDAAEEMAAEPVDPHLDAWRIAFLQDTSGSTSAPKGVIVTHGNVLANLRLNGGAGVHPRQLLRSGRPLAWRHAGDLQGAQ